MRGRQDGDVDVGVYSTRALMARGVGKYAIRKFVESGDLVRLRQGWLAAPHAHSLVVLAVRAGGYLGCVSGCQVHGLWVPHPGQVHVMINPGHPPLQKTGYIVHRSLSRCVSPVASVSECLRHAIKEHNAETALILVESAVNLGKISVAEAEHLLGEARAQRAIRRQLGYFSATAQSGSETRVRLFLQLLGEKVVPQAHIPGVGRVDLLVGERLIIECDSRQYHSSHNDYEKDRERDLAAKNAGYDVIRLSYSQIWLTWEGTQEFLRLYLGRKTHRKALQPQRHR